MNSTTASKRRPLRWAWAGVLLLVVGLHLWVNLSYLPHHALPDEEEYGFILNSISTANHLKEDPLTVLHSIWRTPEAVNGFNLHGVLGALFFLVRPSYLSLLSTSTLLMLVALAFMFLAARELSNELGGALAFIFAAFFPVVFVWSRLFYCDVAIMMTAAIGCFLILRSNAFTRLPYAAAFGVWTALAPRFGWTVSDATISLMAVAAQALPAFVYGVFLRSGLERKRTLLGAGAALILFLLLFDFPWLFKAIDYLRYEGIDLAGTKYAGGSFAAHPESVFAYFPIIFRVLAGPAWTIGFLATLPFFLRPFSWRKATPLFWLFLPLLILSVVPKKNINYVHALTPAMALMTAVALANLWEKGWKKVVALVATILLAVGLWQFSQITFRGETYRQRFSLTRLDDVQRFFEIRFPLHFVKRCQNSELWRFERDLRELADGPLARREPIRIFLYHEGAPSDGRLIQIFTHVALAGRAIEITDVHDVYMNFQTHDVVPLVEQHGLAAAATAPLFANHFETDYDLVIGVKDRSSPGLATVERKILSQIRSLWSDIGHKEWDAEGADLLQRHVAARLAELTRRFAIDEIGRIYQTCNTGGSAVAVSLVTGEAPAPAPADNP